MALAERTEKATNTVKAYLSKLAKKEFLVKESEGRDVKYRVSRREKTLDLKHKTKPDVDEIIKKLNKFSNKVNKIIIYKHIKKVMEFKNASKCLKKLYSPQKIYSAIQRSGIEGSPEVRLNLLEEKCKENKWFL